jgi:hypothetical protein
MEIICTVVDNSSLDIELLKGPHVTLFLVLSFQMKLAHFAVILDEA